MQCHTTLASGRIRLSSLSATQPARDHASMDVRRTAPLSMEMSHTRIRPLSAQRTVFAQLWRCNAPTLAHQLLGCVQPAPSSDMPTQRLVPTAHLDAAWHLAALPEARGQTAAVVGLPLLVPAAAHCFSVSEAGQQRQSHAGRVHAAAAVSPAASGGARSLTVSFGLTAAGAGLTSCHVSGLVVRPLASRGAAAEQSSAEGAMAGITYCTQWQAAEPAGECLVAAQQDSSKRAPWPASAVSLVLAAYFAERASAAALATLQSLALLAAPHPSRAEVELLSSESTDSTSPQLGALLRSAELERSSELVTSSHSDNLPTLGSKLTGGSRLRVSFTAAAASLRARAGPQDTRCAARVRYAPRLLPASASAPGCHDLATANYSEAGGWPRGGCYLVTGGLGALGLAAAGWLVATGASQVRLSSRNVASAKDSTLGALSALLRYAPASAVIVISQADVAAPDDLMSAQLDLGSPIRGAALDWPAKVTLLHPCQPPVSRCSPRCQMPQENVDGRPRPVVLQHHQHGAVPDLQVSYKPAARWRMACWADRRRIACAPRLPAKSPVRSGLLV